MKVGLYRVAVSGLLLVAACACSSSGGVSRQTTVGGTFDALWLAAQGAMADMGGRVVSSSKQAGSLVGRIDVEGSGVQLDVSLTKDPSADLGAGIRGSVNISAFASLIGVEDPDTAWQERIDRIVEQYLELVERRAPKRY